jgi:RNA polymerase-binding transcription factor DksA
MSTSKGLAVMASRTGAATGRSTAVPAAAKKAAKTVSRTATRAAGKAPGKAPVKKAARPVAKATKSVPTVAKKGAPAKQTAKQTVAKPAKSTPKKAAAVKSPAVKSPAKKASAKPTAVKAAPRKATATSVAKPATKTAVTKTAATKSTATKAAPAKAGARRLAVRGDESPWTEKELGVVRAELEADISRLRSEISHSEHEVADLLRDSGDGAGDDQADAGAKTFEREQEISLANNAREMLLQSQRALARIDDGTYGVCEICGNPIGKMRLQAFPRATMCVADKQRQERR